MTVSFDEPVIGVDAEDFFITNAEITMSRFEESYVLTIQPSSGTTIGFNEDLVWMQPTMPAMDQLFNICPEHSRIGDCTGGPLSTTLPVMISGHSP